MTDWDKFITDLSSLKLKIDRSKAINVNKRETTQFAKEVAQFYTTRISPVIHREPEIEVRARLLDKKMSDLRILSSRPNARQSYKMNLRGIQSEIDFILTRAERLFFHKIEYTKTEELILKTLKEIVPSAHLSYLQAIDDLNDQERQSSRGTAAELRGTIFDVLHRLAPDEEVTKEPNFKLEKDQEKPTMRQRATFILRARKESESTMATPIKSIQLIEESIASMARPVYDRGSLSTHIQTSKREVKSLKRYVDALLSDLLKIDG